MSITNIIPETIKVFSSDLILNKIANLDKIETEDYKNLHPKFLTPLSIKIDSNQFKKEIDFYSDYFQQWLFTHQDLPRYSIPLVNLNGSYENKEDPSNGSLTEWNRRHPENCLIETDFTSSTEILDLKSLQELRIFDNHWLRSNILKWYYGAEFVPHIDTVVPSYWLRLWGVTNAEGIEIAYYDDKLEQWCVEDNIESGRIYIIDTSLIHYAKCNSTSPVYQFFLSLQPSVKEILWKLMQTHSAVGK